MRQQVDIYLNLDKLDLKIKIHNTCLNSELSKITLQPIESSI